MEDKNNPFAFAAADEDYLQTGMTLTDYFAAKVIQPLIASKYSEEYIARKAYDVADAMMKVRKERMKNESEKK